MADQDPRPQDSPAQDPPESRPPRRWHGVAHVLIPAATFLLGIALGATVALVSGGDGDLVTDPTAPSPSASPTSGGGETVVTVPAACEDAARNLTEATRLLDDVAASIRDFQPQQLVDLLTQLEELDLETRELASQCSSEVDVSEGASPSETITGVPEETDSPTDESS